jgi:hypothetical protein
MKHRFTIKELLDKKSTTYMDDLSLLQTLVGERMMSIKNINAPLYQRLCQLYTRLEKCIGYNDGSFLNNPNRDIEKEDNLF